MMQGYNDNTSTQFALLDSVLRSTTKHSRANEMKYKQQSTKQQVWGVLYSWQHPVQLHVSDAVSVNTA